MRTPSRLLLAALSFSGAACVASKDLGKDFIAAESDERPDCVAIDTLYRNFRDYSERSICTHGVVEFDPVSRVKMLPDDESLTVGGEKLLILEIRTDVQEGMNVRSGDRIRVLGEFSFDARSFDDPSRICAPYQYKMYLSKVAVMKL